MPDMLGTLRRAMSFLNNDQRIAWVHAIVKGFEPKIQPRLKCIQAIVGGMEPHELAEVANEVFTAAHEHMPKVDTSRRCPDCDHPYNANETIDCGFYEVRVTTLSTFKNELQTIVCACDSDFHSDG